MGTEDRVMPNYVNNILEIRSKNTEDIVNFIKQHYNEDGLFDFNTFVKEPENEDECPSEYNMKLTDNDRSLEIFEDKPWFNWYDWRLKYWGTKWNCADESKCYFDLDKIRECDSYFSPVYIHFTTAWTPPIPIFKKIFEMHPELDINIIYHSTENMEYGWFVDVGEYVNFEEYRLTLVREEEITK